MGPSKSRHGQNMLAVIRPPPAVLPAGLVPAGDPFLGDIEQFRLLPELELLNLSGRRLRQLRHEHHLLRHHVVRQIPPAELNDLGLRDTAGAPVSAAVDGDEGAGALAPAGVGHGDDRRLRHAGVAVEDGLELDAADVLAAGDDDVLGSVPDLEIAVGVDDADVAGEEPAVLERRRSRRRVLEVALHDAAAT